MAARASRPFATAPLTARGLRDCGSLSMLSMRQSPIQNKDLRLTH
jgi:hypothetical protein